MSEAILEEDPQTQVVSSDSPSPVRKVLATLGWTILVILSILFFTLLKLPEDRIKNLIQTNISSALAAKGVAFTYDEGSLSVGLGVSYVLKGVTLTFPEPEAPAHIQKVNISPSFLSLVSGKIGGSVRVENGDGYLDATFSLKNTAGSASYRAKSLDLGKIGILPLLSPVNVKASGLLSGEGNLSGDFVVPSTLSGTANLKLEKVIIDQQAILGFAIPKLSISEGNADVSFDHGKMIVKTLKLGKSAADDIQATLSGDMSLNKTWDLSTVNFKTRFTLSPTIQTAFVLLDAILGQAKQPDGSYAYALVGPVNGVNATPGVL